MEVTSVHGSILSLSLSKTPLSKPKKKPTIPQKPQSRELFQNPNSSLAMALSLTNLSSTLVSSRKSNGLCLSLHQPLFRPISRPKSLSPMAAFSVSPSIGISETFSKLKEQGKVALIPYITAGDPDLSTTSEALKVLDSCGADIIELGMPYSDPLADGPVIQAASTRALTKGTNFDTVISMLAEVVPQLACPVALFSYYNPILKRGVQKFMSTIREAGVHGLVVPDVPLEETEILRNEAADNNIELVLLTTPTTPLERMKEIVEASEGFVYLVSSVGVTGARSSVSLHVPSLLQEIKEATSKPVAVGFGISEPDHVKQVAGWGADGVIVGSAMVRILGEAGSPGDGLKELESFTRSLKAALLSNSMQQ